MRRRPGIGKASPLPPKGGLTPTAPTTRADPTHHRRKLGRQVSTTFDPGEGWRMEQFNGEVPAGAVAYREDDGSWTYWVRQQTLPDAPYTVIRGADGQARTRYSDGSWRDDHGNLGSYADLHPFEILAEPRAPGSATYTAEQLNGIIDGARRATAKAVLDRMHELSGYSVTTGLTLAKLAIEFGAEIEFKKDGS